MESVKVSELATSYVVEGILVESVGMDQSLEHTHTSEGQTQSWVTDYLFYNELDEEVLTLTLLIPSLIKPRTNFH